LNGNRTGGGYATGAGNRLLSDGVYNYVYDDEGNRTKRTNIVTHAVDEYAWDYRNRLTGIVSKTSSNGTVTQTVGYEYDVDDQRVRKTVNGVVENYYLDGNQIAFVTDVLGNETFHYLYGLNVDQVLAQDSPAGMVWALADRLGTVDALTDGDGNVVDKRTFDSFGRILSETNPSVSFRYGYTGRERDLESGLDYYRARYYDPQVGRFISVDPAGFGAGDTNLYRYVGNNSTNATDPTGMWSLQDTWNGVQDYAYGGLVNTDKFVAGFADLATGGYTTKLRNEVYGDRVAGQHEGWQFTAGQVAGFGVTAALGFVTPGALVGTATRSIGAAERIAQVYTVAQTGIGAFNTTTKIIDGKMDWSNPLSYLEVAGSYAPLIGFAAKIGAKNVFQTWNKAKSSGVGAGGAGYVEELLPEEIKELKKLGIFNYADEVGNHNDLHLIAERTGVPKDVLQNVWEHLFVTEHRLPIPDTSSITGNRIATGLFSPNPQLAKSWQAAKSGFTRQTQNGLVTQTEELEYFKRLIPHEYIERQLMADGIPYTSPHPSVWVSGYNRPTSQHFGAHDLSVNMRPSVAPFHHWQTDLNLPTVNVPSIPTELSQMTKANLDEVVNAIRTVIKDKTFPEGNWH
jgi:RHS repeat-associated protein